MRITIEVDGVENRLLASPTEKIEHTSEIANGGTGPNGTSSPNATVETDSGGPPQALLDEIAAAEIAGYSDTGDQHIAVNAGSGPRGH